MSPLNPVKRTLIELRLSHNIITSIPEEYFYGFTKLWTLDLSCNAFTAISQLHLLSATLYNLYLDSIRIQYLPTSFQNATYAAMYSLSFRHNNLSECRKDVLENFPNLATLNLMGNAISYVEDLRNVSRLQRLTVSKIHIKYAKQQAIFHSHLMMATNILR